MKRKLRVVSLIATLATVFILAVTPAVATTTVQVSIDAPDRVMPESNFTAKVKISEVNDFDAANYDVSFDDRVLRLDNVTNGQIGSTPIPVEMWNKRGPGRYSIVQNVPGFPGVSGSGYLAELHFHVVGSGGISSLISLPDSLSNIEYLATTRVLGNNRGLEIVATWLGDSVSVTVTGGGTGSPPETPASSQPETTRITDDKGFFVKDTSAAAEDNRVRLTISQGTLGLTSEKTPLLEISIAQISEPPAVPPKDILIIGSVYDLRPDGASFDPPIELTFIYNPSEVPEGIAGEDLVIAWWDKTANQWVKLEDSKVDINTHTVTASVEHFTPFTLLAYIPPSAGTISTPTDLVISPPTAGVVEGQELAAEGVEEPPPAPPLPQPATSTELAAVWGVAVAIVIIVALLAFWRIRRRLFWAGKL